MSSIEELNGRVTEAIFRAERHRSRGEALLEARVYREISDLERQIAAAMGPGTTQGDIARRGAVRAAIRAFDFQLAERLASYYIEEPGASARVVEALKTLRAKALESLPEVASVIPVRVREIRNAA